MNPGAFAFDLQATATPRTAPPAAAPDPPRRQARSAAAEVRPRPAAQGPLWVSRRSPGRVGDDAAVGAAVPELGQGGGRP